MPTYDYECRKCGHVFEIFEAMSATPKKKCPKCARGTAERMIGAGGGLLFKGSGFYITDYKNKPSPEAKPEACAKPAKDCACAASKKKEKSA